MHHLLRFFATLRLFLVMLPECWRAARTRQSGGSTLPLPSSAQPLQPPAPTPPLLQEPLPEDEVAFYALPPEINPAGRYLVKRVRGDKELFQYRGDDASEAKRHLASPAPRGCRKELWDHNFSPPLCRGLNEAK